MGTISTAIPTAEYQPLLDSILGAADICTNLGDPPDVEDVGGFALAVLARWAANAQAFIILRNANLLTDAYAIARVGSELAIMTAWVECGGSERFPTPAARVKALRDQSDYSTRVWLDKMNERDPPRRRYDDTTRWGRALMAATKQDLPSLEGMAACSNVTRDMYAFAYRGESGAVHSAARVLGTHGDGKSPLPEPLMLHNVLVTALVIFGAVSALLKDPRAADMTVRLQQAIRDRAVAATSAPPSA